MAAATGSGWSSGTVLRPLDPRQRCIEGVGEPLAVLDLLERVGDAPHHARRDAERRQLRGDARGVRGPQRSDLPDERFGTAMAT